MKEINKVYIVPHVPGVRDGAYIFPSETWNNMTFCGCFALPTLVMLIGAGALGLYFVHKGAVDRGCEMLSYMTRACGWK